MNGLVVLLVMLHGASTGPANTLAAPEVDVPAKDTRPLPLYDLRPETYANELVFRLCEHLEPVFRLPLCDWDTWRCYGLAKTKSFAFGNEWYLGYGFAALVELEAGCSGWAAPVGLNLYPVEAVRLSVGFDVLRSRFIISASLKP